MKNCSKNRTLYYAEHPVYLQIYFTVKNCFSTRTHRVYRPAYHMRIPYTQAIKRYYVVEFTPRRNMRISNAFNATE